MEKVKRKKGFEPEKKRRDSDEVYNMSDDEFHYTDKRRQ